MSVVSVRVGLNVESLRFLFAVRPDLKRTLTIGRQQLRVSPKKLERLFHVHHLTVPELGDGFAEPVLRAMGARTVESLDASPFEGATLIHDLNHVLGDPPRRFTSVIDGGTLEHVFHFPNAIRTFMELVEPGGSLVVLVPANNQNGHGLYQFSPELFYRVLEDCFEVDRMLLVEYGRRPTWYRVEDPKIAGYRVNVRTRRSTVLMLHARRTTAEAIPALAPQQSDYEAAWSGARPSPRSLGVKVGDRLARNVRPLQGRVGTPALRRVKL
jgi:hypothetical protein